MSNCSVYSSTLCRSLTMFIKYKTVAGESDGLLQLKVVFTASYGVAVALEVVAEVGGIVSIKAARRAATAACSTV